MGEIISTSDLVIVGNGFDLLCGLKSSYSDFFTWKYRGGSISKNYILNGTNNQFHLQVELGLWDYVFINDYMQSNSNSNLSNKLWSDVESRISNFLSDDNSNLFTIKDLRCIVENINVILKQRHEMTPMTDYSPLLQNSLNKITNQFTSYLISKIRDPNNIHDFIINELKIFEQSFCEYLRNQVKDNSDYVDKSTILIEQITGKTAKYFQTILFPPHNINVLSFNYTKPFILYNAQTKLNQNQQQIINVHGAIDENNIIFGIDQMDCSQLGNFSLNPQDNLALYSKTYRKLEQSDSEVYSFFNDNIQTIKFYGHSLNHADYSYFQSIFDKVDIYSGNTQLIFYYSKYEGKSESDIKNSLMISIYKLFQEYANTFTNKEHGKNLLHKLILENRLKTKEICLKDDTN